jgi:hypothetical protein
MACLYIFFLQNFNFSVAGHHKPDSPIGLDPDRDRHLRNSHVNICCLLIVFLAFPGPFLPVEIPLLVAHSYREPPLPPPNPTLFPPPPFKIDKKVPILRLVHSIRASVGIPGFFSPFHCKSASISQQSCSIIPLLFLLCKIVVSSSNLLFAVFFSPSCHLFLFYFSLSTANPCNKSTVLLNYTSSFLLCKIVVSSSNLFFAVFSPSCHLFLFYFFSLSTANPCQ